jgi:endoglucanase
MGVGWNLGNTLDAFGGETNWGNPKTTKSMIDAVKSAGFKTLRMPVTWDDYLSGSNYTIASWFLDRVEEVANYGLSDNLYVIIDIHHNNGWQAPTTGNEANARDHLVKIWQQIATRFNKYGDKVIFETMNEPRNGEDWTGNQSNYDVLNRLNAAALSTIRNTGGNNGKRLVMLPGYAASAGSQIYAIALPNDGKFAISTHAYYPFGFALDQYGTSTFNTAEVDDLFNRLNSTFISKGIPVVMGEWASTNKNNLSERVKHAEYYVKKAKAVKIPTVWWDNNNATANTGDAMGLLNRSNNTWYSPTIVSAIMNGNK